MVLIFVLVLVLVLVTKIALADVCDITNLSDTINLQ